MKHFFLKQFIFINFTLIILVSLFIFSGCKNSKFNNLISYNFSKVVRNLDPQTATESEEITIIQNIFEGLYRKSADGKFELGIASNVETTNNDKTKIFTLKDNAFWRNPHKEGETKKNATKITADDFVFCFRRLLDPKTNSPFASNYFFIKNAKKVNEGKLPLSELGVQSNEKGQLIIEMNQQTPMLEEILASSSAMPCNKQFFYSTNGRYGTTKENILTNGPFFLNAWNVENKAMRLRIRANDEYHEKNLVKIIGVNFSVKSKDEAFNLFKEKEINTAILNSSQLDSLNKNLINIHPFENKVVGVAFNQKNPFFSNDKIRRALAFSVNKNKFEGFLKANQTIANSLIPNSITICGKKYNEQKIKKNCCPIYDPETAKEFLEIGKNETKQTDLKSHSILINSNDLNAITSQLLQTWQKDLNIFFKINECDDEEYFKKIKEGNFETALLTITSNFNSPSAILNKFVSNSPQNYMNVEIDKFDEILNYAANQNSIESIAAEYFKAEKLICENAYFIPLIFEKEYFVTDNNLQNIILDPTNQTFYYLHCFHK